MTKFKLLRQRESNAYKAITCEQFECAKIKKKSCQKRVKKTRVVSFSIIFILNWLKFHFYVYILISIIINRSSTISSVLLTWTLQFKRFMRLIPIHLLRSRHIFWSVFMIMIFSRQKVSYIMVTTFTCWSILYLMSHCHLGRSRYSC